MSTDPFVVQLANLSKAQPGRAKWVVVPGHDAGLTLGDRLVLEGCDWANLRFVTPLDLALDAAAPFLVEQGLDPLPDGLGPNLLMRLLMDLPAGTPSYFRPLGDQPRMGAALWAALRELRLAGVKAAGLPEAAFEHPAKHRELQALLLAYEQHLAASRQADAADVYVTAAAHPDASPVAAGDLVVAMPGLVWPPLVRAFLDALPGERVAGASTDVPGLEVPRRLREASSDVRGPAETAGALAWLLEPGQVPVHAPVPSIEMFHAAGREAEVEGVVRRILAASSARSDLRSPAPSLDRIEVACASREYAYLLWEKAQRLEVPITVEHGVPVTVTRPARALLAFCDWIDSNFVAGRLRRLFQGGDVRIEFPGAGDGPAGGGQAARLLTKASATWGRETYDRSLAALAARYAQRADEDEELDQDERAQSARKAARAEYLRDWVRDLLQLVPETDGSGHVCLADLVKGLLTFLDTRVAVTAALDAAAVTVMKDALAELLALGELRRPPRYALALVREAIAALSVGASRARPGSLHVSSLAAAGRAGRPFTYIVGLQEGGVFPSLVEDPVLLDVERERISSALVTSHDRLEEAVHAVLSRIAALPADGRLSVSYSCRDLREGRETFPSWLMLQLLRVKERNARLTYDDLRGRLGTPETQVPASADEALTESGWWLATMKRAGHAAADAVFEAFPSLAAGRAARQARESDRFTEWDGFVPAARSALDPRVSGQPVSVTRLERLVSCPFRYFVEHGLGIDVLADDDPDRDDWLDPLQRGSALHEVYATLGREARARGERLDSQRDANRARQLADAILQALRVECPPPSDVVFDRERTDFLRDVDLFLDFEASRGEATPVAFEVSFGHHSDGAEPLAQADPVALPLGEGQMVKLRGTIDRIDRLADGSYEVIDYKTGRYDREQWDGTFCGGTVLQHAVYGIAAATLLRRLEAKPRIARAVYEFASARGGGERVEIVPPGRAALAAVLSDLFDVIAAGAFVAADSDDDCKWCDFARACGMPVEQAAAKLQNQENAGLDAYRRVREVR